jgi:hypothetical protein
LDDKGKVLKERSEIKTNPNIFLSKIASSLHDFSHIIKDRIFSQAKGQLNYLIRRPVNFSPCFSEENRGSMPARFRMTSVSDSSTAKALGN